MKILSSKMISIHKIYGYGNIAIEELLDIDISEKVHDTEEVINEKIRITLSVCYKTNGTSTQNAWFSQNSLFLLLETGKWRGDTDP